MANEVVARQGEKMIVIEVRFFTDAIAEDTDKIVQKQAGACGVVNIRANKSHGIKSNRKSFNSLMEIPAKIEELIIEAGVELNITLYHSRMRKYIK